MEMDQIEKFLKAVDEAAQSLKEFRCESATIVHHNDTDGVTSGAILKMALEREGVRTEPIPVERVHPSFLPKIHRPDRRLILYADLGGQSADMIRENIVKGTSVFILDHHPPFRSVPDPLQINPEMFGIDGDINSAAATVAYLFAIALNSKNDDLAYLAVTGALGDGQILEGKVTGLNLMALKSAIANGSVRVDEECATDRYRFRLFKNEGGMEVARSISDLSVNGYYRRGAELAIDVCLQGPTDQSVGFVREMRRIQEDLFEKEKRSLQTDGIRVEDDMQWVDVEDRFYPLGLKSIGTFCSEISEMNWPYGDKFIVGFQNIPEENPYFGRVHQQEAKVSMRVTPALRRAMENGRKPYLTDILPGPLRRSVAFQRGATAMRQRASSLKTRKGIWSGPCREGSDDQRILYF